LRTFVAELDWKGAAIKANAQAEALRGMTCASAAAS
jgi:hypothetical protein